MTLADEQAARHPAQDAIRELEAGKRRRRLRERHRQRLPAVRIACVSPRRRPPRRRPGAAWSRRRSPARRRPRRRRSRPGRRSSRRRTRRRPPACSAPSPASSTRRTPRRSRSGRRPRSGTRTARPPHAEARLVRRQRHPFRIGERALIPRPRDRRRRARSRSSGRDRRRPGHRGSAPVRSWRSGRRTASRDSRSVCVIGVDRGVRAVRRDDQDACVDRQALREGQAGVRRRMAVRRVRQRPHRVAEPRPVAPPDGCAPPPPARDRSPPAHPPVVAHTHNRPTSRNHPALPPARSNILHIPPAFHDTAGVVPTGRGMRSDPPVRRRDADLSDHLIQTSRIALLPLRSAARAACIRGISASSAGARSPSRRPRSAAPTRRAAPRGRTTRQPHPASGWRIPIPRHRCRAC